MSEDSPSEVYEVAVNLDDVTGQVLGDVVEQLLQTGALDVWTTPIQMKKQRPGVLLSLLCGQDQLQDMLGRVLRLTGSMGVRYRPWQRLVLERRHEAAETRFGPVRLKVGTLAGRVLAAQPEFEDLRQLARRHGVPVRTVQRAAQAAADAWLAEHAGEEP